MAGDLLKRGGRGGSRRAYGAHQLRAEINVTPFVDVMLVLLIVFMVSAPLLTVGVPINLPKAAAPTLSESVEPVNISVNGDGGWFVGDLAVSNELALQAALDKATDGDKEHKVYLRGDATLQYGDVMRLMAVVTTAGYSKLALISSTPSQGVAAGAN